MSKTVLVVGGAGFIGSMVNKSLHNAGYQTIVLDNLCRGTKEAVLFGELIVGDLGDRTLLEQIFSHKKIDAVMHFAAYTDVGESVVDPAKYFTNNVVNTLTLLNTMKDVGVKTFIFSSSAAVYGIPQTTPIREDHPVSPINPYGETKLMIEKILHDYDRAYKFRYASLRYFNAAGGDPDGQIKNAKKVENNLIPLALRSLRTPNGQLTLFGTDYPTPDGTCVRDYIHVFDLASAHILAMEELFKGSASATYNLGNGKGYSVREVLHEVEQVTGHRLNLVESKRRPGDPAYLVADASLAIEKLDWQIRYPDLGSMIAHAWESYPTNIPLS